MMRVGIDATFLAPEVQHTGMGVYARHLIEALATRSGSVQLTLLGYGSRPSPVPAGLAWYRMVPFRAGKLSPWLGHQIVLPRAARRLQLDVLHVPGINLRLAQPGLPFWMPCSLVVTMHDAIPVVYYGRMGPPLPRRLRLGFRMARL